MDSILPRLLGKDKGNLPLPYVHAEKEEAVDRPHACPRLLLERGLLAGFFLIALLVILLLVVTLGLHPLVLVVLTVVLHKNTSVLSTALVLPS